MKKIYLLLSILTIMIASVFYLSFYTVDAKSWVVITQFGKPVRSIKKAGPYFKRPGFLQTVNTFDKRINMFETQPIQLMLGDKNPIVISCYAAWRIKEPLLFFQVVGNVKNAEIKLADMIISNLGIALGDYDIKNIINIDKNVVKLEEIETAVKTDSTMKSKEKYGIEIVKVGIQRVAYPDIVMNAVYERMKSERSKEAKKLRAEGQEKASKIRSEANKMSREIEAKAQKEALVVKGEGDKQAMKIYAQAYLMDPEFFNLIRSLDMYKKIMDNKTTLILSTDSKLFEYLDLQEEKKK